MSITGVKRWGVDYWLDVCFYIRVIKKGVTMPKKIWRKKFKWLVAGAVGMVVLCAMTQYFASPQKVSAVGCPDVKIIFARGSGAERWNNDDYRAFESALTEKLELIDINYEFEDLGYPAVGIGADNLWTAVGAYFSGGNSYEFGASVDEGVRNLIAKVNGECENTRYVLAGYSQGAMVVAKALPSLDASRIIYVATFGDPKIYLPEGKSVLSVMTNGKNGLHLGVIPPACKNENLSNYRAYVPDCYAYEGLLGSQRPYQPEGFYDKLGTWCNRQDIFCSSYYSVSNHTSYVSDKLYEDASKMIFAKITSALDVENKYVSPHDTAILIDSTGSMSSLIWQYKNEALRLAEKTLSAGGRVALYDYRDLKESYAPVEHCNFETCTLEKIVEELDKIVVDGGDDTPESLLSASFTTMNKLSWKYGSTKSVVVLTDAGFHSPDIDGTTFADVVALSKSIDPVNFYVITTPDILSGYTELALATGGMVATTVDDLSVLTDTILARFDSLPRVEELPVVDDAVILDDELPELTVTAIDNNLDGSVTVRFVNSGVRVLVGLNNAMLGVVESDFVTISDLDRNLVNNLRLVPLSENRRGEAVDVKIGALPSADAQVLIPRAPDTGIIK